MHLVGQCKGTVDVETTVYCHMVQASIAEEKSKLISAMLEKGIATVDTVLEGNITDICTS